VVLADEAVVLRKGVARTREITDLAERLALHVPAGRVHRHELGHAVVGGDRIVVPTHRHEQHAAIAPHPRTRRIDRRGAVVRLQRLLFHAEVVFEQRREIVPGLGVIGSDGDDVVILVQRLIEAPAVFQQTGASAAGLRIRWLDGDDALERFDGVILAIERAQRNGLIIPCRGVGRIKRQRTIVIL